MIEERTGVITFRAIPDPPRQGVSVGETAPEFLRARQ